MTTSILNAAQEYCPSLADDAYVIATKFSKLFSAFATCHNLYSNASQMDDATIMKLGKLVWDKITMKLKYNLLFFL